MILGSNKNLKEKNVLHRHYFNMSFEVRRKTKYKKKVKKSVYFTRVICKRTTSEFKNYIHH